MSSAAEVFLLIALFAIGWGTDAHAGKRTVCTMKSPNGDDIIDILIRRLRAP